MNHSMSGPRAAREEQHMIRIIGSLNARLRTLETRKSSSFLGPSMSPAARIPMRIKSSTFELLRDLVTPASLGKLRDPADIQIINERDISSSDEAGGVNGTTFLVRGHGDKLGCIKVIEDHVYIAFNGLAPFSNFSKSNISIKVKNGTEEVRIPIECTEQIFKLGAILAQEVDSSEVDDFEAFKTALQNWKESKTPMDVKKSPLAIKNYMSEKWDSNGMDMAVMQAAFIHKVCDRSFFDIYSEIKKRCFPDGPYTIFVMEVMPGDQKWAKDENITNVLAEFNQINSVIDAETYVHSLAGKNNLGVVQSSILNIIEKQRATDLDTVRRIFQSAINQPLAQT